jgi:GTP-binding protein
MSLRPTIAIVGRPNVGKSTLFNRLVGRRTAIVRDVPGVTRDRLYGLVSQGRWQATVVDTGGFDPSGVEPLIEGVRRQVLAAVDEADLVLFVVDARAGLTALDLELGRTLRRTGRPVVLVANKVDGGNSEAFTPELYRLGFGEPWPVSAEHGAAWPSCWTSCASEHRRLRRSPRPGRRRCTLPSSVARTWASRRS